MMRELKKLLIKKKFDQVAQGEIQFKKILMKRVLNKGSCG